MAIVITKELRAGDSVDLGTNDKPLVVTIADVKPSPYSKNKVAVTYLYSHGGTYTDHIGKNARWFLVNP